MRELRGTVDLSTKRFDPVKTRNESLNIRTAVSS